MAQYESAQFNAVRGKLGGMVFQGSANGAIMRVRAVPKQPRTPAQTAVRRSFSDASTAWKDLPNAAKAGWSSLASQVVLKNRLNKAYSPTGRRLFIACCQNAATVGLDTPVFAPPTPPEVPTAPNFNVTVSPMGGAHPNGQIMLGGVYPVSGYSLVLRATGPLSFDKKYINPSDFRVLLVLPPGAMQPTPDALAALYAQRFGPIQPDARQCFSAYMVDANGFVGQTLTTDQTASATSEVQLKKAA